MVKRGKGQIATNELVSVVRDCIVRPVSFLKHFRALVLVFSIH